MNRHHVGGIALLLAALAFLAMAVWAWFLPSMLGHEHWSAIEIMLLGPSIAISVMATICLSIIAVWAFRAAEERRRN